jgi:hypothetical protein
LTENLRHRKKGVFEMKTTKTLLRRSAGLIAIAPISALLFGPSPAMATPILGTDLASFSVLGATPSVTNTGATTLTGDIGVSPALSITGQATITVNGINALLNPGDVHLGDATASSAQTQLITAMTNLGLLGVGTLEPADLVGLTLLPGVYTVPAGVSNLTGTVTLDGNGNANAAWVFQMPSTLITSPNAVVNVINTGSGAGVYWNVGSAATIDTTTSFEGNILALDTIALNHAATIGCGRALSQTAAVTMDNNTINAVDCTGTGEEGSLGLSGGLDVTTTPEGIKVDFLPFVPVSTSAVPEPGTFLLFGFGLTGLVVLRKRFIAAA